MSSADCHGNPQAKIAKPKIRKPSRRCRLVSRNIAQVFQFPVTYDTMTVGENFAFPLRNRGGPSPRLTRSGRKYRLLPEFRNNRRP
jgi:ABC-type transporter Mla maintaining outer membrane lipid asymmetry ATPase subunit MlaF